MTIRQLISECEKMQKQLKVFENRISAMNTMSENIKILGMKNKKFVLFNFVFKLLFTSYFLQFAFLRYCNIYYPIQCL